MKEDLRRVGVQVDLGHLSVAVSKSVRWQRAVFDLDAEPLGKDLSKSLRSVLEPFGYADYLQTVRGTGYRFSLEA